ncbi:MAG: NifB/NifX family molybdenum-iron cluster-binding protein [Nitrospirae bacterium]|nr:NifB/NifX family molybdenum-iron cluster-binding protein [Nitrospirota bacterium]
MRLCFPVLENNGMNSEVYGHFGSAPLFIIVDTEKSDVISIINKNQIHEHGACNPVMALNGETVDGIIVGGIGRGALMKLNQNGIRVFRAEKPGVKDNVELFNKNELPQFTMQFTCAGHDGGSGCSH